MRMNNEIRDKTLAFLLYIPRNGRVNTQIKYRKMPFHKKQANVSNYFEELENFQLCYW